MRSLRVPSTARALLLATGLLGLTSCDRDSGLLSPPADLSVPATDMPAPSADLTAPADLALLPDLTAAPCTQLPTCACLARPDCTAISTPCFCGDACDPMQVCLCSGGRFLGCAPQASHCDAQPCGVAYPAVGPDGNGCFSCGPLTCASGLASLKANCGFPSGWIDGLTCTKNPDCIAACMAGLAHGPQGDLLCADVGCAFCSTCDCAGNTPFSTCVAACLK